MLVAAGVLLLAGAAYVIVHTKAFANLCSKKRSRRRKRPPARASRSTAWKLTGASWAWISMALVI